MINQLIIIMILVGNYGLMPIFTLQVEFGEVHTFYWVVLSIIGSLLIGMITCWFAMGPGINRIGVFQEKIVNLRVLHLKIMKYKFEPSWRRDSECHIQRNKSASDYGHRWLLSLSTLHTTGLIYLLLESIVSVVQVAFTA